MPPPPSPEVPPCAWGGGGGGLIVRMSLGLGFRRSSLTHNPKPATRTLTLTPKPQSLNPQSRWLRGKLKLPTLDPETASCKGPGLFGLLFWGRAFFGDLGPLVAKPYGV